MNEIYLKTLELLDCSLHGKDDFVMDVSLWPEIFKELEAQTVTCLVAKSINKLKLSPEDKLMFMQKIGMSFQYFKAIGEEQKRIFEILNNENIPVVVLKGFAAAMYYPTPEHRAMGDIDLIFPQDKFEEANKYLNEAGFKQTRELELDLRHTVFEAPSGIHIEPHYKFSSTESEFSKRLDEYVFTGLNKLEEVEVGGYKTYVLPKIENGLVLLDHIKQHLDGGLGLRQIVDWMMYVENCLDNETWEKEFSSKAEAIGLKKLAMVSTAACKRYLGLRNDITWADEVVESEIVEDFIMYILNHGNFGRKSDAESKATKITRLSKNPVVFLKTAQRNGLLNWNAANRFTVLKPFAWAYQIIRWIRHGMDSGLRLSDIQKIKEKETNESTFLEELGVDDL